MAQPIAASANSHSEEDDLWHALLASAGPVATEANFERSQKLESRLDAARYITFTTAGETYGLSIRMIEQIHKLFPMTKVPRTSDFLVGIGNVKGTVMPVIDLALRLGFPPQPRTRASRVLVVRRGEDLSGIIVESVVGVTSIEKDSMEEAPGGIGRMRAEFIDYLGRVDKQTIIFLRLDTLLASEDFVSKKYRRDAREGVVP